MTMFFLTDRNNGTSSKYLKAILGPIIGFV